MTTSGSAHVFVKDDKWVVYTFVGGELVGAWTVLYAGLSGFRRPSLSGGSDAGSTPARSTGG